MPLDAGHAMSWQPPDPDLNLIPTPTLKPVSTFKQAFEAVKTS